MLTEKEKDELKAKISSNKHEIFVISVEEMDHIVQSNPKANAPRVRNSWDAIKNKLELTAGY